MTKTYIAIDGGTTNTRLSFVRDGEITETVRLPLGSNPKSGKDLPGAVREVVRKLTEKYGRPRCVLGCGMLTSEYGLAEVKHIPAPAGISELHEGIKRFSIPDVTDLPIALIPGIRESDGTFLGTGIMRGEESELLGLTDRLESGCLYVLPGSHSKMIRADEKGRIRAIRSFMTGEMQAALAGNTVLAGSVDIHQPPDADYLEYGYKDAFSHGINEAILRTRTMDTQFHLSPSQLYGFFLGAVLEGEVTELLKAPESRIIIGGQSRLKAAESTLLSRLCGKEILTLPDSLSDSASVRGMIRIFEYGE